MGDPLLLLLHHRDVSRCALRLSMTGTWVCPCTRNNKRPRANCSYDRPLVLNKCEPFSHSSKRLMVGLDSRPSGRESSYAPLVPESDALCIHTKPAESHACFSRSKLTQVDGLHLDADVSSYTCLYSISRSTFFESVRIVGLVGSTI